MTTTLSAADFDRFENDDRWLGFGYLNGRRHNLADCDDPECLHTADVAAVDAAIIARATELGWSTDDLFEWANSKRGRWFADAAFSGELDRALGWNLIRIGS